MRKLVVIILALTLAFMSGCGKSESSRSEGGGDRSGPAGTDRGQVTERGGRQGNPGQKPGMKPQGEGDVDIDKLNIPDEMKAAIKSGQIPPDRVREMIARYQGGGGDAVPVNVTEVPLKNLNSYLVLNGIVEPERKIEVFSRLSAYVKRIIKEEGDVVKENDILAILDDTEILISHKQAKIQLDQAKLSLDEAQKNFTRSQELIKKDLISEQEFQTSEAEYKQRQLDHQNRMESYNDLQLQLNWTRIRALSEGFITERLIEVGDRVNANSQVYTIEDFDPLLIRVFVPTSDAIKLQTNMAAEVTTEVLKGSVFEGDVKLINPRIDVETGTVKVTVEVFDSTQKLQPGMFVEVRIAIGQKENVLVIPRKSILYKQNKTYVFVLNGSQVSQREVILGLTEEDDVEVLDGLNEGEVIVLVGVEGLKEGQRVEVIQ